MNFLYPFQGAVFSARAGIVREQKSGGGS